MSAFQVTENHIGAIVRFQFDNDQDHMARWHGNRVDRSHARVLIGALALENWRSVACRYNMPIDSPEADVKMTRELSAYPKLTPVECLKQIDCLDYQSCEHDGWETSEAHRFLLRVRQTAICSLPGYKEAPWGIEEADTRERTA